MNSQAYILAETHDKKIQLMSHLLSTMMQVDVGKHLVRSHCN
jgi:hypothetical protein